MTILIRNQQNSIRLNRARIKKTARRILSLLKHSKAELSILFVDNSAMQELNHAYRGKNSPTDVLSFEATIPAVKGLSHTLEGSPETILGDIVISTEWAREQAKKSGRGIHDELSRLLVHGTLHLLGYDHEKTSEAAKMVTREQEICNALAEDG